MRQAYRCAGAGLILVLTACGGESGGADASSAVGVVTGPAVAPTPTPTPAPTATPAPTPTPTPVSGARTLADLYDVVPDVANCRAGTLKASVKADLLARLNAIRALHRLPAVTYSDADDQAEAESSLMMVANNQLSHTPPTTWKCYTAAGAGGAGSSNLFSNFSSAARITYTEDDYLAGWLREGGSASIGHRRWMLDPFLGKASYGRVTQLGSGGVSEAASLRVVGFTGGTAVPTGLPGFVAYPYGDYPVRYFGAGDYLSFSVVASTSGRGGNAGVDFSRATITVTGPNGSLAVSNQTSDTAGYGLPNNVQWKVAGLQAGVSYTVTIGEVSGAAQRQYSYTFRMVG
ncbi:CAP domain-containing protein [Sphingomonas rubra]|uniref:Uncharacterized conserved protein YkwD, contains CAP (CSP/antigen 5/PR1) domain n=1 Tax=Sphingomonas rubra TaxID=634430 RepID=A0A1I5QW85_9SPHN|nr:CAP domain-containing protein [Sphingomonas rubra]SFP50564.1 Uncharacterized conserved protein YkwD, contains CAP (CSP/antigen 5/PR1) domain [Sphingomonas rubra]